MNQDEQHLDLLAVFHYVVGALAAVFSFLPVFHLLIGLGLATGHLEDNVDPIAQKIGFLFSIFAGGLILAGLVFSVLVISAGRFLSQRRRYTFCLAMAGVMCIFMPFGTVLGVFTILVLMRDSVRARFGVESSAAAGFDPTEDIGAERERRVE